LNIEDKRRMFLRNVRILQRSDAASKQKNRIFSYTAARNSKLGSGKRQLWFNIKRFGVRGVRFEVGEIILDRLLQEGFKKKTQKKYEITAIRFLELRGLTILHSSSRNGDNVESTSGNRDTILSCNKNTVPAFCPRVSGIHNLILETPKL
jgi:hypothetical protein